MEKKRETKNPPLLYNLAELQNECSRCLKISPDETLKIVQELYEKKLVTYPRTDARVLSTAVSKEIYKNIRGLAALDHAAQFACRRFWTGKPIKRSPRRAMSMISRSPTTMPLFRRVRDFGALRSR